jgi:hypothetical protein
MRCEDLSDMGYITAVHWEEALTYSEVLAMSMAFGGVVPRILVNGGSQGTARTSNGTLSSQLWSAALLGNHVS